MSCPSPKTTCLPGGSRSRFRNRSESPGNRGDGARAPVPKTAGNPEGKGVNGFMLDWLRSRPRGVIAKSKRQVLAELFTSMFALSATMRYRPVPGRANYLYWIDGEWSFSLIAPEEWSERRRAAFVGTLVLQPDMTWTIALSDRPAQDSRMAAAIGRLYDAFVDSLDTDRTLGEVLPDHVGSMPYYQRLYASALSRSIRAALTLGDQVSLSCRQWQAFLPPPADVLTSEPRASRAGRVCRASRRGAIPA